MRITLWSAPFVAGTEFLQFAADAANGRCQSQTARERHLPLSICRPARDICRTRDVCRCSKSTRQAQDGPRHHADPCRRSNGSWLPRRPAWKHAPTRFTRCSSPMPTPASCCRRGESARLVSVAKNAAFVLLSGRTDGTTESPAEGRIARQRAVAVRDLFDPGAASTQPASGRRGSQVGDPVAENDSEGGRRRNRRVEVELYGVAPRTASLESVGER